MKKLLIIILLIMSCDRITSPCCNLDCEGYYELDCDECECICKYEIDECGVCHGDGSSCN